jgi:hypothetical protein
MNTVTLREDIRFHTGIPLVGTVPEMDAALKQGFHGNDSHFSPSFPLPNAQNAWREEE